MEPIHHFEAPYLITSDKSLLKPDQVYLWLSTRSHWAIGITFETVKTAFESSFCIGILDGDRQVGYCRLITDYATFGYLADVFIIEEYRGKGLSKQMLALLFGLDWVKKLRRIMLATKDAHTLYTPLGFAAPVFPERIMEVLKLNPYGSSTS